MFSSPPADHGNHVRNLLNQRNGHIDGRISTISEYSDTPSVYSHSYFSPRPSESGDRHIGYTHATPDIPGKSGGNERYEPNGSVLDLCNDRRTSHASHIHDSGNVDVKDEEADGEREGEIAPRMSYLGPKMRFHSRAPWEEDPLEEGDCPANLPMPRKNPQKGISCSPRPSNASNASRPSEDSDFHFPTKRSFETINSISHPRAGLYTLAQENMSSNSFGQRPQQTQKETSRSKFSFSRRRAETPTVPNTPPYPPSTSSPVHLRSPIVGNFPSSPVKAIPLSSLRSSSSDSLEFSALAQGPIHPYANPDLVVSYFDEEASDTTAHANLTHGPYKNTNLDAKQTFSMDSEVKPNGRHTMMPDPSVAIKVRAISTKNISSPVPAIGLPQPLGAGFVEQTIDTKLPGWTGGTSAAPFKLISLEEARALKMRCSTDTTLSLSDSVALFPATNNSHTSSSSLPLANLTRARGRSISAGSKAKNALQNLVGQPKLERRESESLLGKAPMSGPPPGKTLKNKKSGIMRLFNKEKEASDSPPPVPSVPEGIAQRQSSYVAKPSAHRAPASTSSPSHPESANNRSHDQQTEGLAPRKSVKRIPPSLPSINTALQGLPARTVTPYRANATQDRLHIGYVPQSAPPEFPVLRLRPVSTLFSASFGDLVPTEPRSSGETTGLETPRSPSPTTLMSPITPISLSRPSNEQAHMGSPEGLSKIRVLQNEMVSTKKAWQRHIWVLESQVRDLKTELEGLKAKDNGEYCDKCGRGSRPRPQVSTSVVDRPRARTGTSFRFVNPQP